MKHAYNVSCIAQKNSIETKTVETTRSRFEDDNFREKREIRDREAHQRNTDPFYILRLR